MRRLSLSTSDFKKLADDLTKFASKYLENLPELPAYPPGVNGELTQRLFGRELPWDGIGDEAFKSLAAIFNYARPASPRFFGYIFGSGESIATLGEYASSVLHQNATAWRSSPSGVTIERTVVKWLADAIGCHGYSGNLTSGGSIANLMGLCMAREAKLPANQTGVRGGTIYCSSEAHFSTPKAAALLGLGHDAVRLIPVDDDFRMRTSELRRVISRDIDEGNTPIAVVASAGTTATGSIDSLIEIGDICEEFDLWLHIDGAYGALAALATPDPLAGLDRSDSLSLDPHKWLYQPAGCGCLLYKDASAAARAFSHSDDYARVLSSDPIEGFAFFEESIELSRPVRAMALWLSLQFHGLRAFQESIRQDLELAQLLAQLVDAEPNLERLAPVPLSAVCFRYIDENRDLDALNREILDRVIRRGRVYISNATIDGIFALRACIVNHRATADDVRDIVREVLAAAKELRR